MSEIESGDWPLGRSKTTQLVAELVKCSGGAIGSDELNDAVAAVGELYTAASVLELWESGKIEFGWDTDDEQLILVDANSSDADRDGRLILREMTDDDTQHPWTTRPIVSAVYSSFLPHRGAVQKMGDQRNQRVRHSRRESAASRSESAAATTGGR